MAECLVSRDDALHQMVDELETAYGAGNLYYNTHMTCVQAADR